ncbi:hypothetical protein LQK89_07565 [Curtobacterium sp. C1]|uniref:hypothetical protein n=1 Tax=Curtobacterium sp. C1 TaxID=2898151 RepID=UPI001E4AC693|nr:hypothetical protein [Curtobacterium sp. C1]UFU15536.1 hypothetical protein LQK89_07565 [Curtobacterium sp. C1]
MTGPRFAFFRARSPQDGRMPSFRSVFESLTIPRLRWLVTDLDVVVRSGSTVHVHEWDRRLTAAPPPGLRLSHDEMLTLVRDNEQVIDGAFFGVPLAAEADIAQAVIRIDFFDSSEATVVVDTAVIGVSAELEGLLGPAVTVPTIGSRDADTTAYRIRSLLLAFLDDYPRLATPELRQQVDALTAVHESAPRIWDVALAECPRTGFADGPLPGALDYRTDEAPLAGEVLVWMLAGRIDSVEFPWFTTAMPTELPRPDQLIRAGVVPTTTGELHAALSAAADVPTSARRFLDSVAPSTPVTAGRTPARTLAAALRRSRQATARGVDVLAAALDRMRDDPVLMCQVQDGDDLLTVALSATDRAVVGAAVTTARGPSDLGSITEASHPPT